MAISKILTNIGDSHLGQRFFTWASTVKGEKFINQTLPQIETVFATGCYVVSTARQKNIDKDRKNLLQIQNVASGIVGITIASAANRAISKFGEKVIESIDKTKVNPESIRQISAGLRVGLPLIVTSFCMRALIPTFVAMFSGKTMDIMREKRKNKLNVKV